MTACAPEGRHSYKARSLHYPTARLGSLKETGEQKETKGRHKSASTKPDHGYEDIESWIELEFAVRRSTLLQDRPCSSPGTLLQSYSSSFTIAEGRNDTYEVVFHKRDGTDGALCQQEAEISRGPCASEGNMHCKDEDGEILPMSSSTTLTGSMPTILSITAVPLLVS